MQRQEDTTALIALRDVDWKKRDVLNGSLLSGAAPINPGNDRLRHLRGQSSPPKGDSQW